MVGTERNLNVKSERATLLQNLYLPLSFVRRGDTKGELKRGEAPLKKKLPLPLVKGKGIQGIGLIINNLWDIRLEN